MAINDKLKFSWGHIIAFVAMIFVSYVSFMGLTYFLEGSFILAGAGVFIIDVLLFVFFIVPQFLKGADARFKKRIRWERALLLLAVPAYLVAMLPFTHFWTVYDNRDKVERGFADAIAKKDSIFSSYEEYVAERRSSYDRVLASSRLNAISKDNRKEALRLQLIDANYTALKAAADDWGRGCKGVTVWNVFMIGNVDLVENAIDDWNRSLVAFSEKKMHDEVADVESFPLEHTSVMAAKEQLNVLRQAFTTPDLPTLIAYVLVAVIYIMLLFPYIIQRRNTRSVYRLFGKRKGSVTGLSVDISEESPTAENVYKPIRY